MNYVKFKNNSKGGEPQKQSERTCFYAFLYLRGPDESKLYLSQESIKQQKFKEYGN